MNESEYELKKSRNYLYLNDSSNIVMVSPINHIPEKLCKLFS